MVVISQNAFENWKSRGEKQLIINYFLAKIPIELPSAAKIEKFCKIFFNFEQYVRWIRGLNLCLES
jgi:hypothetical protein